MAVWRLCNLAVCNSKNVSPSRVQGGGVSLAASITCSHVRDRARRRFTWVDVIPGRPDVERLLLGHSAHGAANTY